MLGMTALQRAHRTASHSSASTTAPDRRRMRRLLLNMGGPCGWAVFIEGYNITLIGFLLPGAVCGFCFGELRQVAVTCRDAEGFPAKARRGKDTKKRQRKISALLRGKQKDIILRSRRSVARVSAPACPGGLSRCCSLPLKKLLRRHRSRRGSLRRPGLSAFRRCLISRKHPAVSLVTIGLLSRSGAPGARSA